MIWPSDVDAGEQSDLEKAIWEDSFLQEKVRVEVNISLSTFLV